MAKRGRFPESDFIIYDIFMLPLDVSKNMNLGHRCYECPRPPYIPTTVSLS
jgi:hypothetical protein